MTAPPSTNGHFPAGAWWREKLRALSEYLRRTEPGKRKVEKEQP